MARRILHHPEIILRALQLWAECRRWQQFAALPWSACAKRSLTALNAAVNADLQVLDPRGVLIPTTSTAKYLASFGRWFLKDCPNENGTDWVLGQVMPILNKSYASGWKAGVANLLTSSS